MSAVGGLVVLRGADVLGVLGLLIGSLLPGTSLVGTSLAPGVHRVGLLGRVGVIHVVHVVLIFHDVDHSFLSGMRAVPALVLPNCTVVSRTGDTNPRRKRIFSAFDPFTLVSICRSQTFMRKFFWKNFTFIADCPPSSLALLQTEPKERFCENHCHSAQRRQSASG